MALGTPPATSWMQSLDLPNRLFSYGRDDYELYEEDGEFVLSIEMPGFDVADIDVSWNDGVLNVAAEHTEEERNRRQTYHRRFRFPKRVDDAGIDATYRNGILEVYLPVSEEPEVQGKQIDVTG